MTERPARQLDQMKSSRSYHILLAVAVVIFTCPFWVKAVPPEVLKINVVKLMVLAGTYACVAVGLNLLVGYAGQISLGHAAFFGIGAYAVAIPCTNYTWFPTWLGLVLGALVAGLISWMVGVPILRLKGHYLAMATLGLGEIAQILFRQMRGVTMGNVGITGIRPLSIFGFNFDTDFKSFFIVWIVVLLMILFTINLIRSREGRALRALHSSEVAAKASGVNTGRYKTKVFVLSAVFASIGGGLFACVRHYVNSNQFTFELSILFITMVVVGGMGNIWGGLVGVIVLTFLPAVIEALPDWIPIFPESLSHFNNYVLVLYGLLLIVFMIFWPRGIAYGLSRAASFVSHKSKKVRDRIRARRYRNR